MPREEVRAARVAAEPADRAQEQAAGLPRAPMPAPRAAPPMADGDAEAAVAQAAARFPWRVRQVPLGTGRDDLPQLASILEEIGFAGPI